MRTTLITLIALLLLTACGEEPIEPRTLTAEDFDEPRGCADVFVYAVDSADELAVIVRWRGAASRAAADGRFTEEVVLPHPDVEVRLQEGAWLSEGMCTDVMMEDRPVIDREWNAVSGSVEITVDPAEGAAADFPLSTATMHLRDVELEPEGRAGEATWRIDELDLRDLEVGWYPG